MDEASRTSAAAESPPADPADESLEAVAARLHAAAIHVLRRLRGADLRAGVTPARLSALSVLVFGGPCSLSELAAAEQVTPPTMSRLVGALVEEGLVTRHPDPSDGRAVLLEPTAEARRLLEEGRSRRVERLAGWLGELDRGELETVARSAELLESLLSRRAPR